MQVFGWFMQASLSSRLRRAYGLGRQQRSTPSSFLNCEPFGSLNKETTSSLAMSNGRRKKLDLVLQLQAR